MKSYHQINKIIIRRLQFCENIKYKVLICDLNLAVLCLNNLGITNWHKSNDKLVVSLDILIIFKVLKGPSDLFRKTKRKKFCSL